MFCSNHKKKKKKKKVLVKVLLTKKNRALHKPEEVFCIQIGLMSLFGPSSSLPASGLGYLQVFLQKNKK